MDHKVYERQLPGGAKGLIIHAPGSKVARVKLVFRAGYIFGKMDRFEIPHVLEHMMFGASRTNPDPWGFRLAVEENGAYNNAHTNSYENGYIIVCSQDEVIELVKLLGGQLSAPLFTQSNLEAELGNVREELNRNTTNYGVVNSNELAARNFPMSSQTYRVRLGQLESITLPDIEEHYRKYYTRKNLQFFISGDFPDKGERILAVLSEVLADMPEGEAYNVPSEEIVDLSGVLVTNADIGQLHYKTGCLLDVLEERQQMHLGALSSLLTNGWRGWIMRPARDRGIAYGVSSSALRSFNHSGFRLANNVSPANALPLFQLFTENLRKAQDGDFTQEELMAKARKVTGESLRSYQTASQLGAFHEEYYQDYGKVIDFDGWIAEHFTATKDEVVEMAQLVGTKPWDLAIAGDIQQQEADKLYATLEPIWSASART